MSLSLSSHSSGNLVCSDYWIASWTAVCLALIFSTGGVNVFGSIALSSSRITFVSTSSTFPFRFPRNCFTVICNCFWATQGAGASLACVHRQALVASWSWKASSLISARENSRKVSCSINPIFPGSRSTTNGIVNVTGFYRDSTVTCIGRV